MKGALSMLNLTEIKERYSLAHEIERRLGPPNSSGFWSCPFHDDGKNPNFHVMPGGLNFKCFSGKCLARGDVIDFVERYENISIGAAIKMITSQTQTSKGVISQAQINQEQKIIARKALAKVACMGDRVEFYHQSLNDFAWEYWLGQGLEEETVKKNKLGYAPRCPLLFPGEGPDSLVIPVPWNGKLISIRHRLTRYNGQGKYRPEFKGLPAVPYGLDTLTEEDISFYLDPKDVLIVEGEVKQMVLHQILGGAIVGLPGAATWKDKWGEFFKGYRTGYIMLDPEVDPRYIARVAVGLKQYVNRVILCTIQCKPDDFFVIHQFSIDRFLGHMKRGILYENR
jgi:hypothetical protein